MKQKKNYTLKILEDGKVVSYISTHAQRRFTTHLASINFENRSLKIYLKVFYGKKKDWYGKLSTFYNDCWVTNKNDLLDMFEYFRYETL